MVRVVFTRRVQQENAGVPGERVGMCVRVEGGPRAAAQRGTAGGAVSPVA